MGKQITVQVDIYKGIKEYALDRDMGIAEATELAICFALTEIEQFDEYIDSLEEETEEEEEEEEEE